jgi:hypothetical protein
VTGVGVEDAGDALVVTVSDEYAPRLFAVLHLALHGAAAVDEDARRLLLHLGRHALRAAGGIPVAPRAGVATFVREYSAAEAIGALGGCSRAQLWKLQRRELEGFWFKRPGRGGQVLVFDADAVDRYAASRNRGR